MSDNVQVFIRFRDNTTPEKHPQHGINAAQPTSETEVRVKATDMKRPKDYNFDKVMFENSQDDTYKLVGQPLLKNIFDGYNSTLFVYGQTGSGKTYTMFGPDGGKMDNKEHVGIVPRQLQDIFSEIKKRTSATRRYDVSISIVDIYLERVRDLLSAHVKEDGHECNNVRVRWHKKHGVFMTYRSGAELTENTVNNLDECMANINKAMKRRKVGGHSINTFSSRSHLVIQLKLKDTTPDGIVVSKLLLCDLAGSEKVKHTNASGERLAEAQKINYGLTVLGNVLNCMTDAKKLGKLPPFRESKLTMILQDALGGNSKTSLICGARPDDIYSDETIGTLNFGKRAKMVKCNAVREERKTIAQWKSWGNRIKSELQSAINDLKVTEERAMAFERWASKLEEVAEEHGEDVKALAEKFHLKTCGSIRTSLVRQKSSEEYASDDEEEKYDGPRRLCLQNNVSSKVQRRINAQLKVKNDHLEDDLNDLRQKCKAQSQLVDRLENELTDHELQVEKWGQMEKELKRMQGQYYQLNELYKNVQKRNTHLEDALAKTSWDINPMDAIIATIQENRQTNRQMIVAMKEGDHGKISDHIIDQNQEIHKLHGELTNAKKLNGSIMALRQQEKITKKTTEKNILTLYMKHKEKMAEHKNELRTKDEEIARLGKLVENLRDHRDTLLLREKSGTMSIGQILAQDTGSFHKVMRSSDLETLIRKPFAKRKSKKIRRKKLPVKAGIKRPSGVGSIKTTLPKMNPCKTMLSPVA